METKENKTVIKVLYVLVLMIAILFVVQLITAIGVAKTGTELQIKLDALSRQVQDGERDRKELRLKIQEIVEEK